MPRDAVERAHAAVTAAFRVPEVSDRLKQIGFVPWAMAPDALATHIEAETARWIRLAQDMNLQPQ
jgi:tripartite-type tricarboxylate transporter receptor subunit TctC